MDPKVREQLAIQSALKKRLAEEPFLTLKLNQRQVDFTNSLARETALFGLNQGGKTVGLLAKARYHLTGKYPKNYKGHRFTGPITAAMAGVTAQTTRDVLVDRLIGDPRNRGCGYLPKESFDPKTDVVKLGGNVADQVDYILVDWHDAEGVCRGKSKCYYFTYKQGAERVMGYPLDWVGIDEECPFDVYDELSARLNFTGGYMDISMTPMGGETQLYLHFRDSDKLDLRQALFYDIRQAEHFTDEQRDELFRKYEFHPYREARLFGHAVAGKGLIYPVPDDLIACDPFAIPSYYKRILGVDLPHTTGAFAAVSLCWDPNTDIIYVVDYYKVADQVWTTHAQAVSRMGGKKYPVAWPNDGKLKGADTGTGASAMLISKYKNFGLKTLREPSHSIDSRGKKNSAISPVIDEICERMATGRFKVFRNLSGWFKEKSQYRHDGVKVLSTNNFEPDGLDAMHKGMMMKRFAVAEVDSGTGDFLSQLGGFTGKGDFFGGQYSGRRN